MTARLGSWWQKIRTPLGIIGIIVACIGVVVLVFVVVRLYGTGFVGKTLWDWLGLLAALAIPVVVGFGAAWFTTKQTQASEATNQQQHKTELEIATDNQREAALQEYIDKLSELLLKEHLGELKPEYEGVRKIARVRTLTVLPRLDEERKKSVLQFLYESGLIEKGKSIIDLKGADLSYASMGFANLSGAELSEANLSYADLGEADLSYASLREANLGNADLHLAKLNGANLSKAYLAGAKLLHADLSGASLKDANLFQAKLISSGDLRDFSLLLGVSETKLRNTDLRGALLLEAEVAPEQLNQTVLLEGATMPDGSIHR